MNTGRTYKAYKILVEGLRAKAELKIQEYRFTIRATGITRRKMSSWGKDLIPGPVEEGTWKRFNYLAIVWFQIVEILRSFDLPLEIIKKLKESLWQEVSSWDLFQQPGVAEMIEKLAAQDHLEPGYLDLPEETVEAMKQDKHPWLFFMVLESLILRNHWMILVNRDGQFVPLKMDRFEKYTNFFNVPEFIANSFVSVSLTEAIRHSALTADVQILFEELSLLTRSQVALLSQLRNNELQSLRVILDSGAEIELIEAPDDPSDDQIINNSNRFILVILTSGYRSLVAQSRNGGMVYSERGIRNKFSA